MIKLKVEWKRDISGPNIFLSRLRSELARMGVLDERNYDIKIKNPTIVTMEDLVKPLILRVDGMYFEYLSPYSVNHYIRTRLGDQHFYITNKQIISFLTTFNNLILHLIGEESYVKVISPILTRLLFLYQNFFIILNLHMQNGIVYQSIYSKKTFEKFFPKLRKIDTLTTVIYNGIDLKKFTFQMRNKSADGINLVTTGRLVGRKRIHQLVDVLYYVCKQFPKSKLYIFGQQREDLVNLIMRRAKELGVVDNVMLMGKVHPERLRLYYLNMDIMVHPAWIDYCPNAVIEGMASGLPVVCPSIGGTPELVGPAGKIIREEYDIGFKEIENVHKIPMINAEEYANAIIEVYEDLEEYSLLARKRAEEKFDIKKVAKQYVRFAESVL